MALFIRSDRSQDFVQSARRGALARSGFFRLQIDAVPTVLIGSLEEIETGERSNVLAVAVGCLAGLPSFSGAAFRSIHTVLRSLVSTLGVLAREATRTSAAGRRFILHGAAARWGRLHRNRDSSRLLRIARASCTSSE